MLVFRRTGFSELWITIQSEEPLGLLDTGYIENYFGVDGQLTLRKMADDTRISFAMAEDVSQTPTIPHDVFTGFIDLSALDDGIYRVEGRVRDNVGNYRILSEVQAPFGTEDVTLFEIEITPFEVVIFISPSVDLSYVSGPEATVTLKEKSSASVTYLDPQIDAQFFIPEQKICSVFLKEKPECNVFLTEKPELDIINVYTKIYLG